MTDTTPYVKAVTIELDTFRRIRGTQEVKTVTRTTVGVGFQDGDRWVIWYAGPRGAIFKTIHKSPYRVLILRSGAPATRPMTLDQAAIRFSDFRDATDADRKVVFGD